jgi:2-amino-4-hydroxy-6-hydroxymethyldihydropteridine diphosphokinase
MGSASYVIGLGSNRRHGRHGPPERVVRAAIAAMTAEGLVVRRISRTIRTPAMGPSDRDFANAAVLVESDLLPPGLLALLQRIERDFGRRRYRRWGARVLDLDILAWNGGEWRARSLVIPHAGLAVRDFALRPAAAIAPGWRHPHLGRTLRQLEARLTRRRPVDRRPRTP